MLPLYGQRGLGGYQRGYFMCFWSLHLEQRGSVETGPNESIIVGIKKIQPMRIIFKN